MKYNELTHVSHPQHKLKFEYTEAPVRRVQGSWHRVAVQVHIVRLRSPPPLRPPVAIFDAPLLHKMFVQFLLKTPGNVARYCNACEKDVTGFVYHCTACGFDLHPCCAKLPMVLDDGEVKLYLYEKVSAPCHRCGRKGRSWSYRSTCKKYNLHVACVKEMLVDNWHELYFGNKTDQRNNSNSTSRKLETSIPSLKNTLHAHHQKSSKGKVQKCCEMAGLAVQFVISAVLGDPTTLIDGVVGTLMSR